jgi:chemotaxis protein methyltransferase CheR
MNSSLLPKNTGRAAVNDRAPIINNETYFLRDHGQFDLLRLRLLPELIKRRRDTKTLRLWSAGCSSGEEAYSLAMLVDTLLPKRDDWNILILGSDIDESALAKARHGHYGQWSFRMAPPLLKQNYFLHKGEQWTLIDRIRSMVTFRTVDLISESFSHAQLCDMDLILCRNVFIYFSAPTVASVANKLACALSDGGYLMTAHTELIGHQVKNLQSRLFAEGVAYQRAAPPPTGSPAQPTRISPAAAVVKRNTTSAQHLLPPIAPNPKDLLASARACADRGEYDQAVQTCRRVLSIDPLAPEPHFLLAQLAQIKGDFEQARDLLDKTLYLDPRSVAATLELAALCERTQNLSRAQTLRRAALDIVRTLPGNIMIEPYETTAAKMAQWLAQ